MHQEHPNKMEWFVKMEEDNKPNRFIKNISYREIIKHKKQIEIQWDDFSECDSGFCGL